MSSKKTCSIAGCNNPSKKTMATVRISESVFKSDLKLKDASARKVYLCAEHWKKVKKVFKKDTRPERMRWRQ